MTSILAAIPAPPFNSIGPLRLYGLMIALGVLAAVALGRRRWTNLGHDPEQISVIATWAVPAGLVGTRIYHVMTDYSTRYCGPPKCSGSLFPDMFNLRAGGLGIPGGILAGVLVGLWRAKKMGIDPRELADAIIPGLPLAQAIGRWGNYFNQELYGRKTTLPWGLNVDPEFRPTGDRALASVTYHPTFLYEAVWNLGVVGLLLWLDSKKKLPKGAILWIYIMCYSLGRLWVEGIRIDSATQVGGWRINTWMSLIGIGIGAVGLLLNRMNAGGRIAVASDASEHDPARVDADGALYTSTIAADTGADGDENDADLENDADIDDDADLDGDAALAHESASDGSDDLDESDLLVARTPQPGDSESVDVADESAASDDPSATD